MGLHASPLAARMTVRAERPEEDWGRTVMPLRHGWSVRARRRGAVVLDACLRPLRIAVLPEASLTEAQRRARTVPQHGNAGVDARDCRELTPTNPRLLELARRY